MNSKTLTYRDSGVDISKADYTKSSIKDIILKTYNNRVITKFGHFGGAYSVKDINASYLEAKIFYSNEEDVLKSGNTIGKGIKDYAKNFQYAVSMLDYIGTQSLEPENVLSFVKKLCENTHYKIPLIAGETAEMPDIFSKK